MAELKSSLPRETIEHFYTVNKLGNKGAHDDDETPTHEDARKALESARQLALWFLRGENSQMPTGDEARCAAIGNERRATTIDEQRAEPPIQNLFWRRVGFVVLALVVGIVVWHLWDNRSANVDARLEEQRRIEIIRLRENSGKTKNGGKPNRDATLKSKCNVLNSNASSRNMSVASQ